MLTTSNNLKQQLLTSAEIAKLLNLSLNTVHNREWQRRNKCPLMKIGKRTYSLESAFWKWVRERAMSKDE